MRVPQALPKLRIVQTQVLGVSDLALDVKNLFFPSFDLPTGSLFHLGNAVRCPSHKKKKTTSFGFNNLALHGWINP